MVLLQEFSKFWVTDRQTHTHTHTHGTDHSTPAQAQGNYPSGVCITLIFWMNLQPKHDKYCQHSLNLRRKGHIVHASFVHTMCFLNGPLEIRATIQSDWPGKSYTKVLYTKKEATM